MSAETVGEILARLVEAIPERYRPDAPRLSAPRHLGPEEQRARDEMRWTDEL